ncbi:hypothetical protein E2562_014240 [Oryza meyeriana var. granulata]|uniref:Uncharacterized protein n=1 Tax=Oryza meyeriana var. granulata TaxID=110450 RepID=A0A6G1BK51_9ORYZ|nr:hypothetical protein E2562_014240 [Oryza meyeriana var. granulata]KAF0888428.1 hypothetical protein E2562_014240 [Oryza meyeriana var. granulata]
MRRGGGGAGRGGGGGRGGHARRDARPRDDRGRDARDDRVRHGDRRPDYRPRRTPSPDRDHRFRRTPSPYRDRRRPEYRPRRTPSVDRDRRAGRPRGRGDDDRDRDLPRGGRPEYGRAPPYRGDDRGRYDGPPDYMLPDHPSDLGQASLRPARKESEFFGGGPGGRSGNKDSEFFGEPGMTLRVCSTGMGRTSSLYLDRRSPPLPPPPPLPPRVSSPPLYPIVRPEETGFLTGGSTMKAGENFGAGSTWSLLDGNEFQYRDRLHDPYVERSQEREIDRLYPGRDMHLDRGGEIDRLYPSKGVLGDGLAPSTELKAYAGSSSSLLAKERPYRVHDGPGYEPTNGYAMDELGRLSHDTLGHVSDHAHRFSESSLGHGSGHDDKMLLDITRQKHTKHSPRDTSMEYGRRDPVNASYLPPENLYGNGPRVSSPIVRRMLGSSSLTGNKDERIGHQVRLPHRMAEDEDTFQGMHDGMERDVQHSYHGDALTRHRRTRNSDVRYSHSPETERLELARRLIQHEFSSFDDGHQLSDQEVSPVVYRGRSQGAYHDHVTEPYRADDSPLEREYYDDDIDSYDMVDDQDKYDARYDLPNNRNVFSRITLRDDVNEEWTNADQENYHRLSTITYGHSKYKPMSQRLSRPTDQSQFGGFPVHGRGRGGWTKSAKKRLRSALPQSHVGLRSGVDRLVRPNKRFKLSEDNHDDPGLNHEGAPEDEDLSMQKDPSEGSEEFTKQVHQAFLKYTKLLNESPAVQKRYREAAKGSLSCCVCGRFVFLHLC